MDSARRQASGTPKLVIEIVIAGYTVLSGQKDKGLAQFAALKSSAMENPALASNLAWFYAVTDQREEFYSQLERAIVLKSESTARWIEYEVDLDKYRKEERFRGLQARARQS